MPRQKDGECAKRHPTRDGEKRTAGESCSRNADATCIRSPENRRRDVLTGRKVRIRERKNRDKSDFTRVRWQGGQKAPRTRSEDEGQGTSTLKCGRRLGRSTWAAETLSTNILACVSYCWKLRISIYWYFGNEHPAVVVKLSGSRSWLSFLMKLHAETARAVEPGQLKSTIHELNS